MNRIRIRHRREELAILAFTLKIGLVAFAAAVIQSFLER